MAAKLKVRIIFFLGNEVFRKNLDFNGALKISFALLRIISVWHGFLRKIFADSRCQKCHSLMFISAGAHNVLRYALFGVKKLKDKDTLMIERFFT